MAPLKSIVRHVLEEGTGQPMFLYQGARAEADLYDVEFFRDGKRVYSGHTAGTTIEIPAHWTYEGATHEFHAGEYRWYVWPEISGRRSSTASVQTTISIAHG